MLKLLCLFVLSLFTQTVAAQHIYITTGEWPPYMDSKAEDKGCVARLIRDASAVSGAQVHFVFMPWERAYFEGLKNEYIGSAYWYYSAERAEAYHYTRNPITMESSYYYYLKEQPPKLDDLNGLVGHTLILTKGLTYPVALLDLIETKHINVVESTYTSKNFPLLLAGRGNVTILTQDTAQNYLEQLSAAERARLVQHPEPAFTMAGYLLVNHHNLNYAALFDYGLSHILADPIYYTNYQTSCPPLPLKAPPVIEARPFYH
ncbi:substrate-binding periplasmic protein [Pseudoalteromonas fenneropenaei]|uniref:Substrate-binding periplasmic protein n=1 Tax=Pseudoalteromonas fenneropenaei TaxID=1737459 RepID=A0ABV7CNS0_9GAMM